MQSLYGNPECKKKLKGKKGLLDRSLFHFTHHKPVSITIHSPGHVR